MNMSKVILFERLFAFDIFTLGAILTGYLRGPHLMKKIVKLCFMCASLSCLNFAIAANSDELIRTDRKLIQSQNIDPTLVKARLMLLKDKNKAGALPILIELSANGNTYAMHYLYSYYLTDKRSEMYSVSKAGHMIQRCAELGNVICMDTLAGLYERGFGGFEMNTNKARQFYESACNNQFDWEEVFPCYYLGKLYLEGGNGFPKDKTKAEYWWRKYIAITPDGARKLREDGYQWPLR